MIPNWLDMLVALVVVACAFRGYRRGLVREGMALLGLLAGTVLAARLQVPVSKSLQPFVGGGALADSLAYVGVLLVVIGSATIFTLVIRKLLVLFLVDWLDSASGALFGAAQGAILAGLLLFLSVKFQVFGMDRAVQSSELGLVALGMLPGVVGLLPSEFGTLARFLEGSK